jgi:hypothetical protein
MKTPFEKRFDIEVPLDEAKRRFVNRAHNYIDDLYWRELDSNGRATLEFDVFKVLGKRKPKFDTESLAEEIGDDFHQTLKAIEAMYRSEVAIYRWEDKIDLFVSDVLEEAETELGVGWKEGRFFPRGAALLDEKLVDASLDWLRAKGFKTVLEPFGKGLQILLEVHVKNQPQRLSDVVKDMYEALEELTLDANREAFVRKVGASQEYTRLLKEYVDYAHRFRHAPSEKRPRPELSYAETESFVYMTGIFLRLAISVG